MTATCPKLFFTRLMSTEAIPLPFNLQWRRARGAAAVSYWRNRARRPQAAHRVRRDRYRTIAVDPCRSVDVRGSEVTSLRGAAGRGLRALFLGSTREDL